MESSQQEHEQQIQQQQQNEEEDQQLLSFFGFSPKKFYEDLFNVFLECGFNLSNELEQQTTKKFEERFKSRESIDKLVKGGYDEFFTNVYIPALNQTFDDFELYTFNNIFNIPSLSTKTSSNSNSGEGTSTTSSSQQPQNQQDNSQAQITLSEEEKKMYLESPKELKSELEKVFVDLRQVCIIFSNLSVLKFNHFFS